jgi:hypothetical protein
MSITTGRPGRGYGSGGLGFESLAARGQGRSSSGLKAGLLIAVGSRSCDCTATTLVEGQQAAGGSRQVTATTIVARARSWSHDERSWRCLVKLY